MTALVPTRRADVLPWRSDPDPATRYLSRLRPGSVPAQRSALVTIAKLLSTTPERLPWHAITLSQADALAAGLRKQYKPRTVNRMLAAVRGVLDVCRKERWLIVPHDPDYPISQREHFDSLCEHLTSQAPSGKKHGRLITDAEMQQLHFHCAQDGIRGLRDAAIIALGIGAGMRREEIATLRLEHLHLENGRIEVIDGKGGKDRTTFLLGAARVAVSKWVQARGNAPGPVLVRLVRVRDGFMVGKKTAQLSPHAVWEALVECRKNAGVALFTPHDMRRTFCTRALRAGIAIGIVQDALGHESIETTRGYDLSGIDDMEAAFKNVDIPFGEEP
jgi:integrase